MARRARITANEMIRKGGLLNFRRALRHASRYGMACEAAGRLLTLDEYRDVAGLSRSQAFREQAAWRACCGDLSVVEVVSMDALASRGFSEEDREDWIARQLTGG